MPWIYVLKKKSLIANKVRITFLSVSFLFFSFLKNFNVLLNHGFQPFLMKASLAAVPAFAVTSWLNGFSQSSRGPTDPNERPLVSVVAGVLSPSLWVLLTQALTKVAWDFLLYPVQEDTAVKIKIAHPAAFSGSCGEERIWWSAVPSKEGPGTLTSQSLEQSKENDPFPVAFKK